MFAQGTSYYFFAAGAVGVAAGAGVVAVVAAGLSVVCGAAAGFSAFLAGAAKAEKERRLTAAVVTTKDLRVDIKRLIKLTCIMHVARAHFRYFYCQVIF